MNIFFLSDTHFGHNNSCTLFKRHDGTPLRNFPSSVEMDEHIIDRWNSVVKPQDHVYHLGDVAMRRPCLATVARCNGHKRLIRGNHDIFKTKDYLQYFDEVMGMRVMENIIFTHIPIHPGCMGRFSLNVHGHLHHQPREVEGIYRDITTGAHHTLKGGYKNISVEMLTDYTPVSLEELKVLNAG